MKKNLFFLIVALVSMSAIAQNKETISVLKPVNITQLEGTWYGLYMGSQASVTFNKDNTYAIWNEAFSQMNIAGSYALNGNTLSLGGIPGMDGKGLVSVDGNMMDLLVVFGAQGMVQAPTSFNDAIGNPAAMRLCLNRDKKVFDQATTQVKAPATASLAFERNIRLGKGLNLNSVFDGVRDEQPLKQGSIKDIASKGFNSVRIPIRWGAHTLPSAPYTINPDFFKKVDGIVNECLANGVEVELVMRRNASKDLKDLQGMRFKKDGYTFKASQIRRGLSYAAILSKLDSNAEKEQQRTINSQARLIQAEQPREETYSEPQKHNEPSIGIPSLGLFDTTNPVYDPAEEEFRRRMQKKKKKRGPRL